MLLPCSVCAHIHDSRRGGVRASFADLGQPIATHVNFLVYSLFVIKTKDHVRSHSVSSMAEADIRRFNIILR